MCKIKFEIKKPGPVEVRVVDVIGIHITSIFNAYETPGDYEVDFDDKPLMPGRYFYKIYDSGFFGSNAYSFKNMVHSGTVTVRMNRTSKYY
jgi:hypothetical protein